MTRYRLARIAFVVLLLSAQVIYTVHSYKHVDLAQADCQMCLSSSMGTSSLPASEIVPLTPEGQSFYISSHPVATPLSGEFRSYHQRAPPLFS